MIQLNLIKLFSMGENIPLQDKKKSDRAGTNHLKCIVNFQQKPTLKRYAHMENVSQKLRNFKVFGNSKHFPNAI